MFLYSFFLNDLLMCCFPLFSLRLLRGLNQTEVEFILIDGAFDSQFLQVLNLAEVVSIGEHFCERDTDSCVIAEAFVDFGDHNRVTLE